MACFCERVTSQKGCKLTQSLEPTQDVHTYSYTCGSANMYKTWQTHCFHLYTPTLHPTEATVRPGFPRHWTQVQTY